MKPARRSRRAWPAFLALAVCLMLAWTGRPAALIQTQGPEPQSSGWQPANQGLRSQAAITALAFDPQDPQQVYAGTSGPPGLWSSRDGGLSWRPEPKAVGGQPVYALLATQAGPPGEILAATAGGVYERRASTDEWAAVAALPARPFYALAEEPDGAILAGGSGPAMYRRAAGYGQWQGLGPLPVSSAKLAGGELASTDPLAGNPLGQGAVLAVAVGGDGRIFAGLDGAGLWQSSDGGHTWQGAPEIGPTFVAAVRLSGPNGASGLARTRQGLFRTADGGATWQLTGADLPGRVDALAAPGPGEEYLIGTSLGEVYRSADGGTSWQPWGSGIGRAGLFFGLVPVPLDGRPQAPASAPGRSRTWLAGTQSGLYLSDDFGLRWRPAGQGPGTPTANKLAVGADGTLYVGNADGVYRSQDGGLSWQARREGLPPAAVVALAVSPQDPHQIYAGLDGPGLYRSDDGGAHWAPTGWTRPGVPGLLLDPKDPEHLFIRVAYERVYESRDGGRTWVARWSGLGLQTQIIALARDPAKPGILYAGGTEGFFRSDDTGATWQAHGPQLAGQSVFVVASRLTASTTLVAGTTAGLYLSSDGGDHWERWGRGLEGVTVTAVASLPDRPGILYVGTRNRGMWGTHDDGQSWQPVDVAVAGTPHGLQVRDFVWLPDGSVLLAATDQGVYRLEVAQ